MVIAANPSTLINMARTGDQEKESLLRDLRDGTLDAAFRRSGRRARGAAAEAAQTPRPGARAGGDRRADAGRSTRGLLGAALSAGQLDRRQHGRLPAALPALFRRLPGARRGPDRQRGPHDHPAGRRHAVRRPRRDLALLRVHPRRGEGQPATDGAGRPRTARRPQLLHPADDGLRPVPLRHPRRGARDGLPQSDAAGRVFEQGRPLRQRHRREAVGVPRHAGDGAGAGAI